MIGSLRQRTYASSGSAIDVDIIQTIKRTVLFAIWATLSVAAGQQWFGPSPDLVNYLAFYNTITPYFDFSGSRFEYGFQFLSWLWAGLGLGYPSLFVLMAAFSLGCKFYLFDKYLASPILAAISYILGFYLLHEYTQIRAAVGISFALLSAHSLINRKILPFFIFAIAGLLFHYSTIAIPLVVVASRYFKGRAVIGLGAVALIAGSAFLPTIQDLIVDLFSSLNPLTSAYVYNDQNIEVANIFSFASITMLGIILWSLADLRTLESDYLRTFFALVLLSYVSLVLLRDSLELALRLRDALAVGVVFLVFREPLSIRNLPLVFLWFAGATYLFYGYSTTQVLI